MAYVGPMLGQHHQFHHYNPGKSKFGEERYFKICERIYQELDTRLEESKFLAYDEYTIADIATYPWARAYYWAKVSVDGLPHLKAWLHRIDNREATQRALEIPEPFWAFFGKGDIEESECKNAERFKGDV